MTTLMDWFKRTFEAILPQQKGNAWDELKKARQMEYVAIHSNQDNSNVNWR